MTRGLACGAPKLMTGNTNIEIAVEIPMAHQQEESAGAGDAVDNNQPCRWGDPFGLVPGLVCGAGGTWQRAGYSGNGSVDLRCGRC